MSHYLFSARAVAGRSFSASEVSDEAGMSFLEVPVGALEHVPAMRIAKSLWLKRIIAQAVAAKRAAMKAYYQRTGGTPSVNDRQERADLVFFLHGYNNDLRTVLWRHQALARTLAANEFWGSVVSFDWPCGTSVAAYLVDRSKAHDSARFLVEDGFKALAAITSPDCEVNLHVVAHSMGSYVLQESFRYASVAYSDVVTDQWGLQQVALVGADLACNDFKAEGDSMYFVRRATRVTNYVTSCDEALKASNIKHRTTPFPGEFNWSDRIGRKGLASDLAPDAVNCYDVNCDAFYAAAVGAMQDEEYLASIGFPKKNVIADRPCVSHSWHVGNATFAKDLVDTLHGDVDRNVIATRSLDARGRLVLAPPAP